MDPHRANASSELNPDQSTIYLAFRLTFMVLTTALQRRKDPSVLPLVHTTLAFFWSLSQDQTLVLNDIPWMDICDFMNS